MDELKGRLLAGTQRRSGPFSDPLFSGLEGTPEQQLLAATSLATLAGLAGQQPMPLEPMPPDEESDPRPPAPDPSLRRFLQGEFRELVPEWLGLCRQNGYRVAPFYLPNLLDMGVSHRSWRAALAGAAGPRARWLARWNPDWRYLLAEDEAPEVWETGTPTMRVDWLKRLRQRDPARARQLLEVAWPREGASDRAALLLTFREGLGLEDEPWLNQALRDRAVSVRAAAAELLLELPGSALRARWTERARRWVRRRDGVLWAEIPAELPPEYTADGLVLKSEEAGFGDRAWWLCQVVSYADLSAWGEPEPWLAAAEHSEWKSALMRGWHAATERQAEPRWAAALLRRGPSHKELFRFLPHAEQETLLLAQADPLWFGWHENFSVDVTARFWQALLKRTAGPFDRAWAGRLPELALRLPPHVPLLEWPVDAPDWPAWQRVLDGFLDRLTFRQSMHEEMKSR